MIYLLVREMAAAGNSVRVPAAVACRVLGFSEQAYYKWLKNPVSAREVEKAHLIGVLRDLHEDDPEGGYRVLSDDIAGLGYQLSERRVWRLCRIAGIRSTITTRKRRYKKAGPPVHADLVNRDNAAMESFFSLLQKNEAVKVAISRRRGGLEQQRSPRG